MYSKQSPHSEQSPSLKSQAGSGESPYLSPESKQSEIQAYLSEVSQAGMTGEAYIKKYLLPYTKYVKGYHAIQLNQPETRLFRVYEGNEHNRRAFPQIVLNVIAQMEMEKHGAKSIYIEPCVGSGQIFMHLNKNNFSSFHLGDINPFLISIYKNVNDWGNVFVNKYQETGVSWDTESEYSIGPQQNFQQSVDFLREFNPFDLTLYKHPDTLRKDQNVESSDSEDDEKMEISDTDSGSDSEATMPVYIPVYQDSVKSMEMAIRYLYVMNRSLRMPVLSPNGGVANPKIHSKFDPDQKGAEAIQSLMQTHTRTVQALQTLNNAMIVARGQQHLGRLFIHLEDFVYTSEMATKLGNHCVVMIDAPFPKFSYTESGVEAGKTYGTPDDGTNLQNKIVQLAKKIYDAGNPCIICNYATPDLIKQYQANGANPIYTYTSPKQKQYIYMLAVFYKGYADTVHTRVNQQWLERITLAKAEGIWASSYSVVPMTDQIPSLTAINGMKVIFDQPIPVYPVNLQPKE
jgi:hypothetical protein